MIGVSHLILKVNSYYLAIVQGAEYTSQHVVADLIWYIENITW